MHHPFNDAPWVTIETEQRLAAIREQYRQREATRVRRIGTTALFVAMVVMLLCWGGYEAGIL